MTPSEVISKYLISQALFTAPSVGGTWPLYETGLPDGSSVPDDAAAVYDVAGTLEPKTMDGIRVEHYGIQLQARSREHASGYEKLVAVAVNLNAVHNAVVEIASGENYTIKGAKQTSPVVPLGTAGSPSTRRRYAFTLNFLVTITNS